VVQASHSGAGARCSCKSHRRRASRSRRPGAGDAEHLPRPVAAGGTPSARSWEFGGGHTLLGRGGHVEGQDRQHGAVHGHRHRHLVERDAGEHDAHVGDRIDRDARHADVAGDARMVAVVATVGGEIERDAEPMLPGGERLAIELFGCCCWWRRSRSQSRSTTR
jgi:hypothetical protein